MMPIQSRRRPELTVEALAAGARAENPGARLKTSADDSGAGAAGPKLVQFPLGFSAFGRGLLAFWKLSPHRRRHASPPVPVWSNSSVFLVILT